ncbi:MAG: nitroreductase family protein [Candidatus Didemnitutus sp.]|nr:nitroreductase family protein [Candidatus Didemnitutus sp.]
MNITQAIDHRRAVKHFDPGHAMPEAELRELLRLARLAPSSFNLQNYRFVVIRDGELRRKIRAVAWDQSQVTDASALILLCADLRAHEKDPARYWAHAPQPVQDFLVPAIGQFYGGKPQLIRDEAMRSIGLAGMTLMLAAVGLGYESCPMIGFDAEAVSKLINLPPDHAIGFMVAIGKPVQAPWPRGERLLDAEMVIHNRFG